MAGTNGRSHPPFQIGTLPTAREQIRAIAARAIAEGYADPVASALREIRRRLRTDPREFGEPYNDLTGMRMTVRRAAVAPLLVEYGVHEVEPVVLVRQMFLLGE